MLISSDTWFLPQILSHYHLWFWGVLSLHYAWFQVSLLGEDLMHWSLEGRPRNPAPCPVSWPTCLLVGELLSRCTAPSFWGWPGWAFHGCRPENPQLPSGVLLQLLYGCYLQMPTFRGAAPFLHTQSHPPWGAGAGQGVTVSPGPVPMLPRPLWGRRELDIKVHCSCYANPLSLGSSSSLRPMSHQPPPRSHPARSPQGITPRR